jgi:hypothetical protein
MANINLQDLSNNTIGADLFSDSESFLRDLSDNELNAQGGNNIGCDVILRNTIFRVPRPMPTPPIKVDNF